jgi:hypothetical protein
MALIPRARPRSVAGKERVIIARLTEKMAAPPRPWKQRAAMRTPSEGAAPHSAEGKDRQTGQEDRLASNHVGQASNGENGRRHDDEIPDQHPLDTARELNTEAAGDRGQADIDN